MLPGDSRDSAAAQDFGSEEHCERRGHVAEDADIRSFRRAFRFGLPTCSGCSLAKHARTARMILSNTLTGQRQV